MIYFTADTHFRHAAVLGMCNRPFKTIGHHDSVLVERWNAVVRPEDEVWHLGDFAFGAVAEARQIFDLLNGRKHLVRGNHEKASVAGWPRVSVHEIADIRIDGERIVMCHYPIAEWPGYWKGALHLYGHVHGNRQVAGACDVGVDVWGYRPVTLREIRRRVEAPVVQTPASVAERLPAHARQLLEVADRSFAAWEKRMLAEAVGQTVVQVGNDILSQRVDQGGFNDD